MITELIEEKNGSLTNKQKMADRILFNLKNYKKDTCASKEKMKRACLSIIVSKLMTHKESKLQVESITKIYKVLDKSGDGKISKHELKCCFDKLTERGIKYQQTD